MPWPRPQEPGVLLSVAVPQDNEHKPEAAELFFASVHAFHKQRISCEIAADHVSIAFRVWVPESLRSYVESQLYAQYPDCQIQPATNDLSPLASRPIRTAYLTLSQRHLLPIQTAHDLAGDPLAALTAALSGLQHDEQILIQVVLSGRPSGWQGSGYGYIDRVQDGRVTPHPADNWLLHGVAEGLAGIGQNIVRTGLGRAPQEANASPTSAQRAEVTAIQSKVEKTGFRVAVRLVGSSTYAKHIEQRMQAVAAAFQQFTSGELNGFTIHVAHESPKLAQRRVMPQRRTFTLTCEELASIYHLPGAAVTTPGIAWSSSKEAEPPPALPSEQADLFAQTRFHGLSHCFGLLPEDRIRHVYIVGKAGSGKTTVMKHLIAADMLAGRGCAVLEIGRAHV